MLQDSHMMSLFTGDSLPAKLIEENPDWIKEIEASKTSITEAKGKSKQVQLPSDGPKRSLRTNKGLHPGY